MYGIRTCSTSREPSRYNTSSSCLKTCQVLTAPPCARAASTGTGAAEHAPRPPLEIPSGRLISFSEGPLVTLECGAPRLQTRTKPPALSRIHVDGGPAPPGSTVGNPNLITSRPAPRTSTCALVLTVTLVHLRTRPTRCHGAAAYAAAVAVTPAAVATVAYER